MRPCVYICLFALSGCGSDMNTKDPTSSDPKSESASPSPTKSTPGPASSEMPTSSDGKYWGDAHEGNFWLGPVDYDETEWHNACAPSVKYPAGIRELYGDYIMGLATEVTLEGLNAGSGQLCDTCVELEANSKTLIAHVVTFGEETGPNDIDVSPEIDAFLNGASARTANWRFTDCPSSDPVQYTFDGRQWDNTWFFRVWVRNSRLPITQLAYRVEGGDWTQIDRQGDGAWQASSVDFANGFSVKVTAIDGRTLEDDIPGLSSFDPDVGITSHGNFD